MVRIPAFPGRSSKADENRDGVIDERDDQAAAAERQAAEQRQTAAREQAAREQIDNRTRARAAVVDRPPVTDTPPPTTEDVETVGPRARSSLRASVGLMLGLTALFAVLTGVLAAPGVALGVLAAIVAAFGLGSTSRRYVAGKPDAVMGLAFALGAVVIGVLGLTDALPWLNTETDQVVRLRDWLVDTIPWLERF